MFKAIIIGGTGATGKQLLNQLMQNQNCKLVTSIGRKPVLDGSKNDKLVGKKSKCVKWDVFQIDYLEKEGDIRRTKPKSVWAGPQYSTDGATKEFRKIL